MKEEMQKLEVANKLYEIKKMEIREKKRQERREKRKEDNRHVNKEAKEKIIAERETITTQYKEYSKYQIPENIQSGTLISHDLEGNIITERYHTEGIYVRIFTNTYINVMN